MTKREIPFEQWPSALDQFSRGHHGKEARVTLTGSDVGIRPYSSDQPLLGLIDERHGREDETITVVFGSSPGGTSSHSLSKPQHIAVAEWNDAYSAELEIESSDGQRLNIKVGPPEQLLPPEMITDGVIREKPS